MCGIAGIIARNGKSVSLDKLSLLGIDNDVRGGDSVGVFLESDDKYSIEKHVETKLKTYYTDFLENKGYADIDNVKIGMLHTRKASVGLVNESSAQPVFLDDENDSYSVMLHNGTLYNYKQLATKHGVSYPKSDTDSMVLARIIDKKGFDVLSEYEGGVAMAYMPRNENKIYLFHGASKKYTTKEETERPLYVADDGDFVYFSSRKEGILHCGVNSTLIKELTPNKLVAIDLDTMTSSITDVDRSNAVQYDKTTYGYAGYDYGYGNGYGGYSRFNEDRSWTTSVNNKEIHHEKLVKFSKGINTTTYLAGKSLRMSRIESCPSNAIRFHSGFYYKGTKMCDGIYRVNSYGVTTTIQKDPDSVLLYIFKGILLRGHSAYNMITKEYKNKKFQLDYFGVEAMVNLAVYPVMWLCSTNLSGNLYTHLDIGIPELKVDHNPSMKFSGTLHPILSKEGYVIKDGLVESIISGAHFKSIVTPSKITSEKLTKHDLFLYDKDKIPTYLNRIEDVEKKAEDPKDDNDDITEASIVIEELINSTQNAIMALDGIEGVYAENAKKEVEEVLKNLEDL